MSWHREAFKQVVSVWSKAAIAAVLLGAAGAAGAQEVRYSWLDIAFMAQEVGKSGTQQTPVAGQFVDVDANDGDGIRFRGSIGTWNNLYAFVQYGSTDIDVSALVTNPGGMFPADDEFDLTQVRSGIGLRYPVRFNIDVYGEVSYDSLDFDFGSFAGEDFDADDQDIGGALGVRAMLNDDLEARVYARYTPHEDIDLTLGEFDTGTVFGVGFAWQLVRGFSIIGDYESGEFAHWAVGFRLDLDED